MWLWRFLCVVRTLCLVTSFLAPSLSGRRIVNLVLRARLHHRRSDRFRKGTEPAVDIRLCMRRRSDYQGRLARAYSDDDLLRQASRSSCKPIDQYSASVLRTYVGRLGTSPYKHVTTSRGLEHQIGNSCREGPGRGNCHASELRAALGRVFDYIIQL